MSRRRRASFAATGSRGGYMLSCPVAMPSGFNEISELLLPELHVRATTGTPTAT